MRRKTQYPPAALEASVCFYSNLEVTISIVVSDRFGILTVLVRKQGYSV